MALALWQLAYVVFPALAILHLIFSPYTKVEESFNIQAIHDILKNGVPLSEAASKFRERFDHMTFPGAVPRTFIGSLVLSGLAKPGIWLSDLAGLAAQKCVRTILGGMNGAAMAVFARSIERAYGPIAATWYVVLQASQFHIWYYASRTLPNMFAFLFSTIGLACLLPDPTSSLGAVKRTRLGLYLITIATVIFRSELALLLGAHCLWFLLKPRTFDAKIRLIRTTFVPAILPGALIALVLTIGIDSYFWQTPTAVWPELSAFLSNVFPEDGLGASAWGTHPFYWYQVSALPRLLMNQILMVNCAFVQAATLSDMRIWDNLIPSYAYVLIYSMLAHKETRFMFPIVPSLTLVAALTCTRFTTNAHKSMITKLLLYAAILSTIITAFISHAILLPLSAQNYPGGQALVALHEYHRSHWLEYDTKPVIDVHLTNLALQSGITLFLEQPPSLNIPEELLAPSVAKIEKAEGRLPIILPGDANHPALTIHPKSPTASSAPLSDKRIFHNPVWRYDKTSNGTKLFEAMFWEKFDFAIVENPAHAIGPWDIVQEVKAVGRPRLLKPGESIGLRYQLWDGWTTVKNTWAYWWTPDSNDIEHGSTALLYAMYPDVIASPLAKLYNIIHDVARVGKGSPFGSLTKGYWLELPLETKLYILKRTTSGTASNKTFAAKAAGDVTSSSKVVHQDGKINSVPQLPNAAATDQDPLGMSGLGPFVVNKDGTLSRLDNWAQMTEKEKARTLEYLKKRNMLRLEEVETVTQ